MRQVTFKVIVIVAVLLVSLAGGVAYGQLTLKDIEKLRKKGEVKGWTFTVGLNPATQYSLEELCGQLPLEDKEKIQLEDEKIETTVPEFSATAGFVTAESLPSAFDWRELVGGVPIKDQQNCASCWAFSAVGAFEFAILIHDGVVEDLSEQWLISCTRAGNGGGGYYSKALNYFAGWSSDKCDEWGAVMEADYPYIAHKSRCYCFDRYYVLRSWYYTGDDIASIKEGIYNYGPVCTSVYADTAMQAYTGGVFNACKNNKDINHAVVLVGWDDSQGTNGVWIMRNSWGPEWGEEGYMRIEYDCSLVGEATAYVDYSPAAELAVYPLNGLYVRWKPKKDPVSDLNKTYTVRNYGDDVINWTATKTQNWLNVTPVAGSLIPGQSEEVQVCPDADYLKSVGSFTDTVIFTDTTHGIIELRDVEILVLSLE
jgi:C1A family cysteine protease